MSRPEQSNDKTPDAGAREAGIAQTQLVRGITLVLGILIVGYLGAKIIRNIATDSVRELEISLKSGNGLPLMSEPVTQINRNLETGKYHTILDGNLFHDTRREYMPPSKKSTPTPIPEPSETFLPPPSGWKLRGVFITDKIQRAYIRGAPTPEIPTPEPGRPSHKGRPTDQVYPYALNAEVGEYILAEIHPDKVVLVKNEGQFQLLLRDLSGPIDEYGFELGDNNPRSRTNPFNYFIGGVATNDVFLEPDAYGRPYAYTYGEISGIRSKIPVRQVTEPIHLETVDGRERAYYIQELSGKRIKININYAGETFLGRQMEGELHPSASSYGSVSGAPAGKRAKEPPRIVSGG